MLLSFNINANLWTGATPITGNVRAVGLLAPAYDEWSTMWGENQHAHFRDAKTDQKSFYKAINEEKEGEGAVVMCVFFGARQREGFDYVMGRRARREQLHVVKGVEVAHALWLAEVPLLVHPKPLTTLFNS